jgi:hypothetical protein
MTPCEILLVGETPSLGRSLLDLLTAAELPCRLVHDLDPNDPGLAGLHPTAAVVVACNEPFCRTARRWSRGELLLNGLVVVGSRDPILSTLPGVSVVPLPLAPATFLELARALIEVAARPAGYTPLPAVAGRATAASPGSMHVDGPNK